MRGSVLVVDDDDGMCDLLEEELGRLGFRVESTRTVEDGAALVRRGGYDSVVTDLKMRGGDGLQLCRAVAEIDPQLPVIVVTAFGSFETAVGAIRAGAYDFLTKPFEVDALAIALDRAIELRRLRTEVHRLRETLAAAPPIGQMVGESEAVRNLSSMVDRVADAEVSVLIVGETGTGKELVARALHVGSRRRSRKFVAVNCAAIPEALLESELFGHKKGAFTGAHGDHDGLFVQADGGTLFLDEIAELPLGLQAKLLRALQERRVRPVGATTEREFDVRVLAATHVDLERASAEQFRSDLLYRINVVRIDVPPLRERGNDVLLLAQHFIERAARRATKEVHGLTAEAAARMLSHDWPGNVRELQNCVERAVALTQHDQIVVDDLPPSVREHRPKAMPAFAHDPSRLLPLSEIERRYTLHVLEQLGGSRTEAAKVLGLDRKTLYRHLRRYEEESQSLR